jgi:hypothetical protein
MLLLRAELLGVVMLPEAPWPPVSSGGNCWMFVCLSPSCLAKLGRLQSATGSRLVVEDVLGWRGGAGCAASLFPSCRSGGDGAAWALLLLLGEGRRLSKGEGCKQQ